jgi:hypothetical protein
MGDPSGAYRRSLLIVTREPGVVVADLEDDFHRFRVVLEHDGAHVTAVSGEGLRTPWTTCGSAGVALLPLVGAALDAGPLAAAEHADPKANCTHMFDIAGLAFSHAAAGRERRRYDVELPAFVEGQCQPRLWRDGELLVEWTLELGDDGRRRLVDPPPYSDPPFQGGFMRWAATTLDADAAEAAIVLRRSCDIGMGRHMDLDAIDGAIELGDQMLGVCFTMQPGQIEISRRNKGEIRDFTRVPEALLADVADA